MPLIKRMLCRLRMVHVSETRVYDSPCSARTSGYGTITSGKAWKSHKLTYWLVCTSSH